MSKRLFRVLFQVSTRALDRLVNGYLLHPRRRAATLAVMTLALVTLGTYATLQDEPPRPQLAAASQPSVQDREAYLMNRIWLDKQPRGERDPFNVLLFQENSVGVFVRVESFYKFQIEIFAFSVRGNNIEFRYPHAKQRAKTDYRIEDSRNGPFNLKMTVAADPRNGGAAKEYFSQLESPRDLPAWLEKPIKLAIEEYGRK